MSNQHYEIKPQDSKKNNYKLLYICTSKYQGDWNSIPHTHHFTELFYVISGRGSFLLNGIKFPISSNHLIIVPPGHEHTEQSLDANPLEYIALGIEGLSFSNTVNLESQIIHNCIQHPEILTLLKLILHEAQNALEDAPLVCQNLLDVLIIHILRAHKLIPVPSNSIKMTKACSQIKYYLDSNYSEAITLDLLAQKAHMNKYYIAHAFTQYTGISPINYLNAKRIQVSKKLLTDTDYSIAQIASSIGFSSQSYFSQVFKKSTHVTPNEYRKMKMN